MTTRYDTMIIGAGVAGLGIGAILSKEAGRKVLVLDRFRKPGGRLIGYDRFPGKEWRVDVGLHMVELGERSSIHELNRRIGHAVAWGPFSRTVDIWDGKQFVDIATLVPMTEADTADFRTLLQRIAVLTDPEIEAWDNRSLAEWLEAHVSRDRVRELLTDLGMIMTTIPHAGDMAAGEFLYIARDNLIKTRKVLQASYPVGGMEALTRGLVTAIEQNGGSVRTGCEVDEVIVRDGAAVGVAVVSGEHPYEEEYRIPATETLFAKTIVCALPIYRLDRILDFNPETSPLPGWWIKRINDIRHEITGLIGYMIGLSEPAVDPDRLCFFSALKTRHAGRPFQGFPASNFAPDITPPGGQLLHTDIVCEHPEASNKFARKRLLGLLWEDIREMFPGIEGKVEWKLPYYVDGCDGLARKPGLVGGFKPGLKAPGIQNLYFAGDTYIGRGLAMNGAALSAMMCADLILKESG